MPKKIKSNLSGIKSLVRIYNRLFNVEYKIICLDFSHTTYIAGEQLALLGAITYSLTYKYEKKLYIQGCSEYIEDLFVEYGLVEIIRGNINNKDGESKSAVKFKYFTNELQSGNTDCFEQYMNDEFSPKLELEQAEITYINRYLSELFVNARTHGDTKEIFCGGQKYTEINKISFIMIDLGVGIPKNVRKLEELSDCKCIRWSIEKGNTTKNLNEDVGGLGLNEITEFISKHNGDLTIVSAKGQYNYKSDIELDTGNVFYGTIVYIDFDYTMLEDVGDKFKIIKNDKGEWNF